MNFLLKLKTLSSLTTSENVLVQFIQAADELMLNEPLREEMAKEAKKLGVVDASDRLIRLINKLINS